MCVVVMELVMHQIVANVTLTGLVLNVKSLPVSTNGLTIQPFALPMVLV